MNAREKVLQEAAANLASQILTQAKDVTIIEELKLQQHEYAEFNKSLETAIINQIIDNEILAKPKALDEEEIESHLQKLKQLQLEGTDWAEFSEQLRKKLETTLEERSLTEPMRNAIDGTLASIAMIKPRNNWEERLPTCPITLARLNFKDEASKKNIVALSSDGHIYDAQAIATWSRTNTLTPVFKKPFTHGDYQRIKAKVPEFKIPQVRNENRAEPEARVSRLNILGIIALVASGIGGVSAFAAGVTSTLATLLAMICPPIGVFALAGIAVGIVYAVQRLRRQPAPPQQAADFPALERKEETEIAPNPNPLLGIIQARRNSNPQPTARAEVELQEVKLELKEQKQAEPIKRRNSSPDSLFSHPQTSSAENQVASEKKNVRKFSH